MRLIVTRPKPDGETFARKLERLGFEVIQAPLLDIRFDRKVRVEQAGYQAVCATSANAIRAFARLGDFDAFRKIPLYAVGEASAQAAHKAGFEQVISAQGDLSALAHLVKRRLDPGAAPVLYATGSVISGDFAGLLAGAGFRVERVILYDAVPARALGGAVEKALVDGHDLGVVLMSPRTADIWADLVAGTRFEKNALKLVYFCLSPAVAAQVRARLGLDQDNLAVAQTPDQAAMIAAVVAHA